MPRVCWVSVYMQSSTQRWANDGSTSGTLAHHSPNAGQTTKASARLNDHWPHTLTYPPFHSSGISDIQNSTILITFIDIQHI